MISNKLKEILESRKEINFRLTPEGNFEGDVRFATLYECGSVIFQSETIIGKVEVYKGVADYDARLSLEKGFENLELSCRRLLSPTPLKVLDAHAQPLDAFSLYVGYGDNDGEPIYSLSLHFDGLNNPIYQRTSQKQNQEFSS